MKNHSVFRMVKKDFLGYPVSSPTCQASIAALKQQYRTENGNRLTNDLQRQRSAVDLGLGDVAGKWTTLVCSPRIWTKKKSSLPITKSLPELCENPQSWNLYIEILGRGEWILHILDHVACVSYLHGWLEIG